MWTWQANLPPPRQQESTCRASKTKARAALADLHDNEAVEVDDKRKRRKTAN